jgi:hypothetical protein
VKFKDCKSGKVLQLTGHFPLSDPWWCATLYVNSKKEVVSGPSYTLRSDNGVMSENHVQLLMLKCGVKSDQAEKFLNALRYFQVNHDSCIAHVFSVVQFVCI